MAFDDIEALVPDVQSFVRELETFVQNLETMLERPEASPVDLPEPAFDLPTSPGGTEPLVRLLPEIAGLLPEIAQLAADALPDLES